MKKQLHKFWEPTIKKYGPIVIPPEYDEADCSKMYCFSKEEIAEHDLKRQRFLDERAMDKIQSMERKMKNLGREPEYNIDLFNERIERATRAAVKSLDREMYEEIFDA